MTNVRSFGDSNAPGPGGVKRRNEENEDGEIRDEDEDDDPFYCEVCNIRFEASRPYFTHLHSVSHLTKSQSFAFISKQNWRRPEPVPETKPPPPASGINSSAGIVPRPSVMPLMSLGVAPPRHVTPLMNVVDTNSSHSWDQQLHVITSIPVGGGGIGRGMRGNGSDVDSVTVGGGGGRGMVGHGMQMPPYLVPGSNSGWNQTNSFSSGGAVDKKTPVGYADHRGGVGPADSFGGGNSFSSDFNDVRSGGNFSDHRAARADTDRYEAEREVTPLIEGCWIINQQRFDEPKFVKCEICSAQFFNAVAHELHLAGLRHKMEVDEQGVSKEIPENITDFEQMVIPEVKPKSREYSAFEEVLHCRSEPLLGFDYLTEFRHISGRQEYVCDLCDVSFQAVESVVQHVTGLKHSLTYINYHDPDVYKIVADKTTDLDYIKNAVSRVEKKLGGKFRMRVKVESKSSDGENVWKELEDDNVRPVSALLGHRLNLDYSCATSSSAPNTNSRIDSVDSLLRSLSMYDTLSQGHPPSHATKPISRLTLLKTLAAYEIRSDKDADVCLQLANSMTLSLLQYRLQQLPSMDAIDTSKISEKLIKLCQSAETVADKMRQVDVSEGGSLATPVSSIVPSSTASRY